MRNEDPRKHFDADADAAKLPALTPQQEAEHAQTLANVRKRLAIQRAAAPEHPALDANVERKRIIDAYARCVREGKAGEDYFPSVKCEMCGGLLWFDADKGRFREFHFADRHGLDETVSYRRRSPGDSDGSRSLQRATSADWKALAAGIRRTPADDDD